MPPVIAAIASAAWTVVSTVSLWVTTSYIGSFVFKLALSAVIGAAFRALQPKPKSMDQGTVLQTKLDAAYPREVAVGKFATGGSLAYENISGSNNRYLWRLIVLSDVEIEEITQVLGNGEALTFSGDIHTGLRACTSHFQDDDGNDMLSLRIYKGASTQVVDPDLDTAFTEIDSDFRLRGCAYALLRMDYSPSAYQAGMDLVFTGKGAKCYDPRTGATVWTDNAALIARQYLKGFTNNGVMVVGVGCSDSDLPDTDWIAAADECDEAVTLAAGGTEARYRAGGMINSREEPRTVLADLAAAMGGFHVDTGGQVVMLPGVTRAAIMDIAEEDLLSDAGMAFAGRRTADERVNCISSTFVNPDDKWQESPLPPRKDAARITADGARYETGRAYRFVFSKTQGQRLDEIELRRGKYEGFLSIPAPLWAFELAPGDIFTMTSVRWGGVQKMWEVESLDIAIVSGKGGGEPQARCAITARETGADVYLWSTSDELTVASGATTNPARLSAIVDNNDRIITVDGLPLGALSGTGIARTVAAPLSSSSSSSISVAAHDAEFVGVTYSLPSATISGLSSDTQYFVFYDLVDVAYDASADAATVRAMKTDPSRYIPLGAQLTQNGGGGFSPPPPPPPGGGGGGGGYGGGGGDLS